MPVEFLSDEQAQAYGTFAEEPTRPELERFFFLDDVDRGLIALRRTEHHRLGFALQMCTVRYVGLFLEDPLAVPWPVIEHLAVQLGIEDPSAVKRYTERRQTLYDHAWEIRGADGYHPYEDAEWGRRFRTFLHGRAWTHAEGPKSLFDHAVGWLRRHRVLLPGVSVLARQVSEVRKVAEKRLHATVAGAARRGPGPGAAWGSGGDAEDAGGLAVLGAGAAAPAADADDGYGVRPCAGAGGRDRRVPARPVEAVADPAEPDGGAGPVRAGVEGAAAGAGSGAEAHGEAHRGDAAPGGEGDRRGSGPVPGPDGHPAAEHREAQDGEGAAVDAAAAGEGVAGIGQMVVPGTPRDSLHILDALLNLDGGVKPEMVATDNASYSEMVFGLFKILGYNFSPRFRDLDDQRFWRATMPGVETGTYGAVEDLARNRVNLSKVITHWPDMLKVAGSLVTDQVRAYDLLRMFGRDGRPTPLGAAFAEYGRIAKTEHLLRVVDPVGDTYRRQMNRQLTVQESRHKLARDVCHGKRGTIHQAYRDGMEDQLGALGLVLNAIVLWTTKYIDAAVAQLGAEGHEIRDEDIARLSPLKHRNLNLLGRHSFTASVPAAGALRPLRDPDASELDEDETGAE